MIDASGLQPRHVRAGALARVPMHVKYALEASEDTFRPAGAKIAQAAPAQATQIALATPGPAEVAPLDEAISGAVPIEASIAGARQASSIYDIGDVDGPRGQGRFRDDVPQKDLTFGESIDIINPLQHIPLVSSVYRWATGDEISGSARIMGATLYGGPIGLVAGIANAISDEANGGRDLGETALAALFGDEETPVADPVTGFAIARAGPGQLVAEAVQEPLVTAAGPEPEGNGTTQMTGQAALDALASDLRGQTQLTEQQTDNPIPTAPVIPVIPVSLDAQSSPPPSGVAPGLVGAYPAVANADSQFAGAVLGGKAFADRMMNALDKYQAMSRGHGAVPVGQNLDGKF